MNELKDADFNFSVFGYEKIEDITKFDSETNTFKVVDKCKSNGITFKYTTGNADHDKLINGCMVAFNKIFAATTPGYVKDPNQRVSS
jgi:hypothetical protein